MYNIDLANVKSIVADIVAKHNVENVAFVGCGASKAELYPAKYFLANCSKKLRVAHYTANEFNYDTPDWLGDTTVVITASLGGSTPETVKANPDAKFIYVIPNFQNPTGRVMSLEKRKGLYELACKDDFIILEDNPYGDLRFAGSTVPSIKSMDTEHRVIYSGTFSKILAPGLRVGYVSAPKEIIAKITVCKQVADVHW
mgnify:CR=1 FL=1